MNRLNAGSLLLKAVFTKKRSFGPILNTFFSERNFSVTEVPDQEICLWLRSMKPLASEHLSSPSVIHTPAYLQISLNCCYSRKIISAELRANMRAAPYLKGLSWNWIVRNSRKLLKILPFAREGCAFQNRQIGPWPPTPYFWNHLADFWAHVNICALRHLFIGKYNLNMKANCQHNFFLLAISWQTFPKGIKVVAERTFAMSTSLRC